MSDNIIKIQDSEGNNYYPQTKTSAVKNAQGATLDYVLNEILNSGVGKAIARGGEIFNDYDGNTATGEDSHAQNRSNTASGNFSDAGGLANEVLSDGGFSRGALNVVDGLYTAGIGMGLLVDGQAQTVLGQYNIKKETGLLIVGYGSDEETRANALRVGTDGRCYGSSAFGASGADVAEEFEWLDGNPNNEDRRGLFVTLDGEKIKLANSSDDYILGIVSATPSLIGDTRSEEWHNKFKKDIFGADIWETVEVAEKTIEVKGKKVVIPAHTELRRILNPDYDPNQEYVSRDNRKEWIATGLIGKIVVVDDGTCEVNGYCTVGNNGVGTKSETKTHYRVMKRIDETHVKVMRNF